MIKTMNAYFPSGYGISETDFCIVNTGIHFMKENTRGNSKTMEKTTTQDTYGGV